MFSVVDLKPSAKRLSSQGTAGDKSEVFKRCTVYVNTNKIIPQEKQSYIL